MSGGRKERKERKKKDRERSGGRIKAFMQRRRDKANALSSADARHGPEPASAPSIQISNLSAPTTQHVANPKASNHALPNNLGLDRSSTLGPSDPIQTATQNDSSYSNVDPLIRGKICPVPDGFSPILQEHELSTPVIGKAMVSADLKRSSELNLTKAYSRYGKLLLI
ncbi:hypothetical protein FRC11_003835 [Ceratobasidium sp. 423]|nr:hypothetical protein FRC11_003835 [Ceratobasidium sp. 423]